MYIDASKRRLMILL